MTFPDRVVASALRQPLAGILPHRFQQPVAKVVAHLLGEHQALVGERGQEIEDFSFLHSFAGADPLGSLHRPPSRKH